LNLKPRSFVSAASQRTLEHSAYVHCDQNQNCLAWEKVYEAANKLPMILQRCGLSQPVLSALSDNHPAGPNWLDCRGVDRRPSAPLTGAVAPRPLAIFAPEITPEKGEPSKPSMQKPVCNSPALAFASSQNRAQVQFFMQNRCRPFPSDHLQGSSEYLGSWWPFSYIIPRIRDWQYHPSLKVDPSGLDRLSFASHPPIRKTPPFPT
jgi:hypothetical protein